MLGLSGNRFRGGKENKQRPGANVRPEASAECKKEERQPQQGLASAYLGIGEHGLSLISGYTEQL